MSSPSPTLPPDSIPVAVRVVVTLRWWAAAGQALAVVPGLVLGWLPRAALFPYAVTVAGLVALNVATRRFVERRPALVTPAFLSFQLSMDALALSVLLWLSGGPWNPFAPLLLVHGALGGYLLRGPWLAGFGAFLFALLGFLHWDPNLPVALQVQPTPSTALLPAQAIALVFLVAMLARIAALGDAAARALEVAREGKSRVDRLRALGIVATGFSHEFATPLSTLRMRLDRLARRADLADDEDLAEAREAATTCQAALRGLLRKQLAPGDVDFETFALVPCLERTIEAWQTDHAPVRVALPVASEAPFVHGPRLAFTQMIMDVLDNALRASRARNSREVFLALEVQWGALRRATIAVSDAGAGFPDIVLRNLGQPFFSAEQGGTGLGLYHAFTVCEAMGGRLEARNVPGEGARVEITVSLV